MSTGQGSQFAGSGFLDEVRSNGIAVSVNGRGQWRDSVFVERRWKSVKYEVVYLKPYEMASAARSGISTYVKFDNARWPQEWPRNCEHG